MVPKQLYSATYSNVPVYEFLVNGGSVMRRKADDWVNATHILKAANFAKAKRTRILEKEVQTGTHEKVQGGYGKYQGTWVPLEDAKLLARRFNVQDILEPVLNFVRVEGEEEPPLAPRHHHAKTLAAQAANKQNGVDSSRSTSGSPALATRSSTFPLKRGRTAKTENTGPPKKRGRPRRVESIIQVTPGDSAQSSILESGNENFDMLKTIDDKTELTKNGLPKKKRGRKPKNQIKTVSLDESVLTNTTATNIKNAKNDKNNSTIIAGGNDTMEFQTPVKDRALNNKLIKSFVDEKSSPLNENDFNNYFNKQNDRHHMPTSSDIEEDDEVANVLGAQTEIDGHSQLSRMFHEDPSSSPSEFMSDHDLARALKTPENMSGLGIKNRLANGHSAAYLSFINNNTSRQDSISHYNGYFSAKKKYPINNPDYTHSIPTPTSSLAPRIQHDDLHASLNGKNSVNGLSNVRNAGESDSFRWFGESDEFTKKLIGYFMKPDEEINDNEIPEFLFDLPKSFDINKVIDPDGNTALHWACAMGNLPIVELLLKFGANLHSRNKKQESPMMRTVRFNNSYTKRTFSKIIELMREAIFDVDGKNRTILHHIALASNSPQKYNSARYYAEILLAKIRDSYNNDRLMEFINLTDRKGNTPLFYALSNSSRKCAKVFLSHGARTDIKNNKGETASDLMVLNYPPTPKLINNHHTNVENLNKLMLSSSPDAKKQDPSRHTQILPDSSQYPQTSHNDTITNDTITERNGNTTISGRNGKVDIGALPHILQAPRYSEVVINAVEKTAFSLVEQLNNFAELYDDELQKKQLLIYDLNKCYNELNIEISTLEKNIINSSISANQLLSSSMSDNEDENKNELAKTIINTNYKKICKKINKQSGKLNEKIEAFEKLLEKIQIFKLNKAVETAEHEHHIQKLESGNIQHRSPFVDVSVKSTDQDGDVKITDFKNSLKSSAEEDQDTVDIRLHYSVLLSKLQYTRRELSKKIFANFVIDTDTYREQVLTQAESTPENNQQETPIIVRKVADVVQTISSNQEDYSKIKEKSKKLNLYRRLVAACCNIGIDEVDELIDIVLNNLQRQHV